MKQREDGEDKEDREKGDEELSQQQQSPNHWLALSNLKGNNFVHIGFLTQIG